MLALLVASTYAGDILDIIEDCGKTLKKILYKSFKKNFIFFVILHLLKKEKKSFSKLVNPKEMIDLYF